METRHLTSADRDDAIALWQATDLTRPWNDPVEDFDRAVAGATSTVLGAFDEGRIVATAMAGHDGHRGWVYYVAVHPTVQNVGLGTGVMRSAETWLRDQGVPKLNLMVRSSNVKAREFYEKLGYEDGEVTVMGRRLI